MQSLRAWERQTFFWCEIENEGDAGAVDMRGASRQVRVAFKFKSVRSFTPQIIEADRIFFDNEDMLYLILIPEAS